MNAASPADTPTLGPARGAAIAFVTAFLAFFVQILLHRIISAKLLGNYAFLVVSLAMLGLAVSGVVLGRARRFFFAHVEETIAASGALFALSALVAAVAVYRFHVGHQFTTSRPDCVATLFRSLPLTLLAAVPFAFVGLVLGVLLSSRDLPSDRIYFFDLAGSALGAVLALPAIPLLGVERGLAVACAVTAASLAALALPKRAGTRALAAVAVVASLVAAAAPHRVLKMTYPDDSMLASAKSIERIEWDALGRVEVSPFEFDSTPTGADDFPCLRGRDPAFRKRLNRIVTHNNYAFTYAFDYDGPASLAGIDDTLYVAGYRVGATEHPRVAVLGAGGGIDVLAALSQGAREVDAVEVNAGLVKLIEGPYRHAFGRWVDDPRVHLATDDGRHFLEAAKSAYDVIQLTSVESGAGAPSSAHVFSEAYIYTEEAFELYLDRLSDHGVLSVMHIEQPFPREMLRVLTTAVRALRSRGVKEPWRHVVTLTANPPHFATVLVKKTPFTVEELGRLERWATGPYFAISASPRIDGQRSNAYQAFLALDEAGQDRFIEEYPFDIEPVVDDQPFFFRSSFWWHLFPAQGYVWEAPPQMEYSILVLLLVVGVAVVALVWWPLRRVRARAPSAGRYGAFFGGIGLGFMFVELALLQKLGLLLGHPNYGMSVVLAALLFTSGVGSLLSRRLVARLPSVRFVAYLVALLVFVEAFAVFPALPRLYAASFAARALAAVAIVAPLGLAMGVFMPTALARLKLVAPSAVPWAWGVNGVFSVLAPVIAMAFSMTFGITALLLLSVPAYLVAALALPDAPAATAPSAHEAEAA